MKWRNEQIYHLRQSRPLTEEDQNTYFENIVSKLFDQEQPNQILFSFLNEDACIGYGGLVHINWIDRHAEISFIMNTSLETYHFDDLWSKFLSLVEQVSFSDLTLHKIFTYAFNLRPHLYKILEENNFHNEAILKEHSLFNGKMIDVFIHSKFNYHLSLEKATEEDINLTFEWANNKKIREFSFSKELISIQDHKKWYLSKLSSKNCLYYIFRRGCHAIGSIRIDFNENQTVGLISYLIDPNEQGKGYGTLILQNVEKELKDNLKYHFRLVGLVMTTNISSIKVFEKLHYSASIEKDDILKFQKEL
jgi:RimJ/RimL family protein N-acetyltransferase